jgi:hypothetical protein
MNVSATIFRGIGFGYYKTIIKTIPYSDNKYFDLELKNYLFLFLIIGVYRKVNYRTIYTF